jgi:hypothetical protein
MMPIRPENKALYPKDWPEISRRIRFDRAGGRCEQDMRIGGKVIARCEARNGEPHPITGSKVVLTVAHLDHNPENNAEENLKAMCQRCHLRYDQHHHKACDKTERLI